MVLNVLVSGFRETEIPEFKASKMQVVQRLVVVSFTDIKCLWISSFTFQAFFQYILRSV